ncbi:MAG: kelch repeat-containing protein, partial [Myxococcaceae bacterium]
MNRFACFFAACLLLPLSACESRSVNYKVRITSVACAEPQPLSDAQQLRFRITGDGLNAPIDSIVAVSARSAQVTAIPAGTHRVVEVRAYAGEVAGGRVVAVGRSMPFDVPDTLPPEGEREREVKVFLRRANAFSQPSDLQPSSTCQRMRSVRAGHTATLLPDGKVLVAGGFSLEPVANGTGYTRTSLSSTEIFDPETGTFSDAPPMGLNNSDGRFSPLPRAFHSATALSTGQVLLAGGEVAFGG